MKKPKKLIACLIVSILLFAYVPAVFASDLAPFVVSGAQSLLSTDFAWDTTKYPDSLTTSTEFNTRVALSKEWGFTYGAVIGSGRSLDRANGLGGKAADDTSVKITGNSSSVDIYLEKEFNGGNGYTEGVVTLKFKLWSDSNQYLKLRCGMDGLVKDLWIAASTNEWTEHSVVLDLDNEAAYYDSNANPADLESNVLKRFRFIMCPGDGKSIALDDLSIDYCKPGEETVSENTVTISGTAQKGSTVKAYVNGVLNNSCTVSCRAYSITADGLAPGDNTVVIEVQAPGGGVSSYTKTINFVKEITVSPADGEYISEVPRCFNAVCQDAETIVFELDGRMLGEADAEGNVRAPESLDYGNHSLKLTAIFADGSACIRETSFNYYQKVSYDKSIYDFDSLPDITSDASSQTQSSLKTNYNWVFYNGQSSVSRIPGSESSGNDGDYALYVEKKAETGSGEARLVFDENKETVYTTNGKIELNFDLMLTDPSKTFRCFFYPRWTDSYVLIQDGKLYGTNTVFPANKWVKINMEYDLSDAGGDISAGVCTVKLTVDGETTVAVNSVKAVPSQFLTGIRITFSMYNGTTTADNPIAMAIDNFSLTTSYYGIEKCTYIKGGAENEITAKVPCDAEQIKLYLNEEITGITKDDVSLVTDGGVNVPVLDVIYNSEEKSIVIEPSSYLPGNTGISVKLSSRLSFKGSAEFGKNHSIRFVTDYETLSIDASFKRGALDLYTAKQIKKGDIISAKVSVTNISAGDQSASFILSLRDNKKLVSMVSETISLTTGEPALITLTLPEIPKDGDYVLYLMNMDSLSNGLYIEDYMEIK